MFRHFPHFPPLSFLAFFCDFLFACLSSLLHRRNPKSSSSGFLFFVLNETLFSPDFSSVDKVKDCEWVRRYFESGVFADAISSILEVESWFWVLFLVLALVLDDDLLANKCLWLRLL